jgi:osmotically-inducible protein OsmY
MEVPMINNPILGALILAAALSGCATLNADNGDARTTAAVESSLARHPELGAPGDLQVETVNHVVYLHGIVANDFQRSIADSVALQASNNAVIVNSIAVSDK